MIAKQTVGPIRSADSSGLQKLDIRLTPLPVATTALQTTLQARLLIGTFDLSSISDQAGPSNAAQAAPDAMPQGPNPQVFQVLQNTLIYNLPMNAVRIHPLVPVVTGANRLGRSLSQIGKKSKSKVHPINE